MAIKQRIKTFLWFPNNAEEAVNLYVSLFHDAKILQIVRCGEGGPGPKGSVLTLAFQLEGQEFVALNGGPQFPFTEAISLAVSCDTQAEIDTLWEKLTENGGAPGRCGWLKDRFGLSWQIVPSAMGKLLGDPNPERAKRVMAAMMPMTKLDLEALHAAFEG